MYYLVSSLCTGREPMLTLTTERLMDKLYVKRSEIIDQLNETERRVGLYKTVISIYIWRFSKSSLHLANGPKV